MKEAESLYYILSSELFCDFSFYEFNYGYWDSIINFSRAVYRAL